MGWQFLQVYGSCGCRLDNNHAIISLVAENWRSGVKVRGVVQAGANAWRKAEEVMTDRTLEGRTGYRGI